jgi:hypothetical protein
MLRTARLAEIARAERYAVAADGSPLHDDDLAADHLQAAIGTEFLDAGWDAARTATLDLVVTSG